MDYSRINLAVALVAACLAIAQVWPNNVTWRIVATAALPGALLIAVLWLVYGLGLLHKVWRWLKVLAYRLDRVHATRVFTYCNFFNPHPVVGDQCDFFTIPTSSRFEKGLRLAVINSDFREVDFPAHLFAGLKRVHTPKTLVNTLDRPFWSSTDFTADENMSVSFLPNLLKNKHVMARHFCHKLEYVFKIFDDNFGDGSPEIMDRHRLTVYKFGFFFLQLGAFQIGAHVLTVMLESLVGEPEVYWVSMFKGDLNVHNQRVYTTHDSMFCSNFDIVSQRWAQGLTKRRGSHHNHCFDLENTIRLAFSEKWQFCTDGNIIEVLSLG